VGRVHFNDVRRNLEHTLGMLVFSHDGAEVGHRLGVLFGVGDLCQWMLTVVLWEGEEVGPGWVRGVGVWGWLVHSDNGDGFRFVLSANFLLGLVGEVGKVGAFCVAVGGGGVGGEIVGGGAERPG